MNLEPNPTEVCEHGKPPKSCAACWPEVVIANRDARIRYLERQLADARRLLKLKVVRGG